MTDNSISTSVRMSQELRSRIDELAKKQSWSVNKWIVKTLQREAFKHDKKVTYNEKQPEVIQ